ncbi:MAG: voltage-gated potassium channel [Thermoleophilaceae bacterium]|jgi:hypothetical protein|nr:voltage-gated potassium channel [Thermoleophilaceae bacterium]
MYPARVLQHAAGEFKKVVRAETQAHGRLRDHLATILVATVVLDLICALIAFALEHNAKQTEITNFGSALFWTTTQMLTVSSNINNPITTGAHFLDVFMEIWAITIVASVAGAVGAFLVKRG